MLKIYEWDWVGWDGWMDPWTHLCYEHRSEVLMILIDNITNIWISYNHTFDVLKCCHHAFTVTNFESDNFVGDDEPLGENQYQQLQFPFSFLSHHHFLINNLLWGWDTVASGWGGVCKERTTYREDFYIIFKLILLLLAKIWNCKYR